MPYLAKGRRADFHNGLEGYSNSGPILDPGAYFSPIRIMAPPQDISILCQMKYASVQVSYLWFSDRCHIWSRAASLTSIMAWELTWIVAPFCPRRLFESDLNNGPSPNHFSLVSDEVYICSGLLLMVSWQVPYLAKGCRPDFTNGLGVDSNSGPILAPGVYFSPTWIMAPPQAIPKLNCKHELALKLFQASFRRI